MKGTGTSKRKNPIKIGLKWSKRIFKFLKWLLIILIFVLLFNFLLSFFGLGIPFPFGFPATITHEQGNSDATNKNTATPTITHYDNVTLTPTATVSITESVTLIPTASEITTKATSSSPTPTATPSPTPTATPSPTPTATPSPTPTSTPSPTPTSTPSPTPTSTPSPTPTVASTSIPRATVTLSPNNTSSNTNFSDNSSTNSNVTIAPNPTSYIFIPSVECSPTPKTSIATLPPANSALNYDYVTYIELDLATIKDLFNSENTEITFPDLQLTISNNVLHIMSDDFLVEFDTYSNVFHYLQNKNITTINIQNLYILNVNSVLSCCNHYNISKMHIKWIKNSSTDIFQMKFVMDQSIWSIITKGVCNYDLTN